MKILGILSIAALTLAGCSSTPPAPTPAPTVSTSSAVPSPPATTPSPFPTPTVPAVWPLTGVPLSGGDASKPALMVKVDNVGGAVPQAGLNSADVVFEEPVEGGLTRFVAVFHSTDPGVVGPIRSARPVDADISRILGGGGILLFSGASRYEIRPVKAYSQAVLIADDWATAPGTFYRDRDRSGEHDLFAYADRALTWAQANASSSLRPPQVPFEHIATASPSATTAAEVSLRFGGNRAAWEWSGDKWLRSQNGRDHDTVDDGRISADSVIVLSVTTSIDPQIHDVLGNPTPVVDFLAGGKAWVLREGKMTEGAWSRDSVSSPLALRDSAGQPMGALPGRTWVEIVPAPLMPSFS